MFQEGISIAIGPFFEHIFQAIIVLLRTHYSAV